MPDAVVARDRRARLGYVVAAHLILCLLANPLFAQTSAVINRENTLKALFIYNFGSYVEWPREVFASPTHEFEIGVLGSPEVTSVLREIAATKRITNRPIAVRSFRSASDVRPVQILFIARDVTPTEQQQVIKALSHAHTLIVGESAGLARHGAVINFFVEHNKLRFEINLAAAQRHGLKVSAKLLSLAKVLDAPSETNP